jgi:hypothetical protein
MATVINASYTADATPKPAVPSGVLQAWHYQVTTTTLDGADVVILDHLPDFAFKCLMTIIRMTDDAGGTLACTLGYGTYDGTTYTAVDADQFGASLNFETEGPTIYYPPDADVNAAVPATLNYVLALTLGGSSSNFSFTGEITMIVYPA